MTEAWELIIQSLPNIFSDLNGQSLSELVVQLLNSLPSPGTVETCQRSLWWQPQELSWRCQINAALQSSKEGQRAGEKRDPLGAVLQSILREPVARDTERSASRSHLRALPAGGSSSVEESRLSSGSRFILKVSGAGIAGVEEGGDPHRSSAQELSVLVSGGAPADPALKDRLGLIESRLERLLPLMEQHAGALASNTEAIRDNTSSRNSTQRDTILSVSRGLSASILSTITLSPLISGLARLFGGGSKPAPVLGRYSWPERLSFEGGVVGQTVVPVDYVADGSPRILEGQRTLLFTPVTVNVQAMDTRSFLDHKNEIAAALKEAILNAHSVADVLWELQE